MTPTRPSNGFTQRAPLARRAGIVTVVRTPHGCRRVRTRTGRIEVAR